jgi:integrase/recombinase XerD
MQYHPSATWLEEHGYLPQHHNLHYAGCRTMPGERALAWSCAKFWLLSPGIVLSAPPIHMNGFFKDRTTIERMTQGPVGPYMAQYAAALHTAGYTRLTGRRMLDSVAGFNRWLQRKSISPNLICSSHIQRYLQMHWRGNSWPCTCDRPALTRLLTLLRAEGVIPEPAPPICTPCERVIEEYDAYLKKERVLSETTRTTYQPLALQFLRGRFGSGAVDLSRLRAPDVIDYVQRYAKRLNSARAQSMRTAVRSFLQFARYRGDLTLDLGAFVPSVARWSLSTLPKSLPPEQVEHALTCCPRTTAVGRQAYAVLLLLARLGLRAGEVVRLTLEDIDWAAGRVTIQGKMNRVDQLPLPTDVGKAIVAYLKHARPHGLSTRRLFVKVRAPHTGFKGSGSISYIVDQALAHAGINSPRKGAHQLRHTLACKMLRQGRSLREIGEILRHRSPDTTAIYAKLDLLALRQLALPWPGGER